ncbi:hypothetical protein Mgra_00009422 [Meloidogyne graminicola]|uniref:Uncharacterized protein n=1 Tax=Meloidogyne graminicola TaxID=189291 RepID=A0A8S9Z7V6_9BILA|nr:hypothetical protein Mgra_00009422 [Meloidogyne graminicola]
MPVFFSNLFLRSVGVFMIGMLLGFVQNNTMHFLIQ